ncbi:MAG: DNA mismatch repair protein MutS, partial [Oscillospiraceae bacterium]|nr:DNA mismatch repair protein MutS [Oscillospiraceae bacterium]
MDSQNITPMMRQYYRLKEETNGCILFFRLGDFYEMFDEDAHLVSRELNLTLTTRDRNAASDEERTMMCGVPYHSAESYIARLLNKGYKIAISEQMEDPATVKGLVAREITRIVTPGTVTEPSMLEERRPNYIASVYIGGAETTREGLAVCFCDVSTGETSAAKFAGDSAHILNELVRYQPSELLLSADAAVDFNIKYFLSKNDRVLVQQPEEYFEIEACRSMCLRHFAAQANDAALFDPVVILAAGSLLGYLHTAQKNDLAHINSLSLYSSGQYMELDWQTRRNLELTETLRGGEKRGSLLWALDKTKTSMGGRLLRSWIERPLLSPTMIRRRLIAVDELSRSDLARGELTRLLKDVDDIERLISRVVT